MKVGPHRELPPFSHMKAPFVGSLAQDESLNIEFKNVATCPRFIRGRHESLADLATNAMVKEKKPKKLLERVGSSASSGL